MSRKFIIVYIMSVLFIAAGINFTQSKYIATETKSVRIRLEGSGAVGHLQNDAGDTVLMENLLADYYDDGALNTEMFYFDDLTRDDLSSINIALEHEGAIPLYVRMKIDAVFYDDSGEIIEIGSFNIKSNTLKLYKQDGYVYVKKQIETSGDDFKNINFYLDLPDDIPDDVTASVTVEVEAVQFNCAQSVWGLESFPWEDS